MLSNQLEWFIAQGKNFDWSSQPFSGTIRSMIRTKHHEWGFVIYRCAYGDDELWEKYMKCFEENVLSGLEEDGGDAILPQYAQWTVREDREALEGASIDTVRKMFVEWRNEHSVKLKVHWTTKKMPMLQDPPNRLPRFTYCLYVDQKCLNTVKAHAEFVPPPNVYKPMPPLLVAALIDGDYDESQYVQGGLRAAPDERGQFPAVDGRTCRYVGWEYVDTHGLGDQYEELHGLRLDDPMDYERPPRIWLGGDEVMTDDGVQKVQETPDSGV